MNEQADFIRGTVMGAALVAVAGGAVLVFVLGWQAGAAFVVGALVSLGNFQLIARAVAGGLSGPAVSALWKGSLFRLVLAGAVLLVALLLLKGTWMALAGGLLVTQFAMIVLWLVQLQRAGGAVSEGAAEPQGPEAR